jgi:hypothetical protein
MLKGVFKNNDNSIGIITPTQEALQFATLKQILDKDVPAGLPYWIIDESELPKSREFRAAWQIDESLGEPHGFGGESNEFDSEVLARYNIGVTNDNN